MNSTTRFCCRTGKPPRSGLAAPDVVRSNRISSCIKATIGVHN